MCCYASQGTSEVSERENSDNSNEQRHYESIMYTHTCETSAKKKKKKPTNSILNKSICLLGWLCLYHVSCKSKNPSSSLLVRFIRLILPHWIFTRMQIETSKCCCLPRQYFSPTPRFRVLFVLNSIEFISGYKTTNNKCILSYFMQFYSSEHICI